MSRHRFDLRLLIVAPLALAALLLAGCTGFTPIPIPIPVAAPVAPDAGETVEDAAVAEEAAGEEAAGEESEVALAGPLTLEGVTWQVSEYRSDGAVAVPSAAVTMLFEDGQVSGSGGCNRFFAAYTDDGNQLTIGMPGSTMMACEEEVMASEQAILGALSTVGSFAVAGQQLHLFDADGALLLSAAPEVTPADDVAELNPDPVEEEVAAEAVELAAAEAQEARGRVLAQLGVNIRVGPGTDYPIVGIAPLDAEGELVGISADGQWLVANVPTAPDSQGWVAAAYVEATGAETLPVIAAPPLPAQTAVLQEGTPAPIASGTILYSASRVVQEGNRVYELDDIYAVPAAGGQPQMVANNAMQPALSPDRSVLAVHSLQSDKLGLGGYDVNTGRRLRFSAFIEDSSPRWSPTGDRLVFASNRQGDRRWRIYTTPATDKERPADMVYNELTLGKDPDWHPSTEQLVFKGCDEQGQNCGTYTINADGSGRALFTNEASDSMPRWLPDGSGVVFMSEGRDGNWEIYRADATGGSVTRLTDDPAPDGLPAVSPDGQQIAFISKRSGAWGLWVMPAAGGAATQIAAIEGDLPDWLEQSVDWAR